MSQRRVWGTDVYTDDSDPVAAAIHNGWIRGSWGDDIDVELLDDELNGNAQKPLPPGQSSLQKPLRGASAAPTDQANMPLSLDSPPHPGPVAPPADCDAHITLLILPALECYAPSTWHGIRSREWGSNHDGLSFMVHKLDFVDEGEIGRRDGRTTVLPKTQDTVPPAQLGYIKARLRAKSLPSKGEARRQRLRKRWDSAPSLQSWKCGLETFRASRALKQKRHASSLNAGRNSHAGRVA